MSSARSADLGGSPAMTEMARFAPDLVVAELSPPAASLLVVAANGAVTCCAARAPEVRGGARREVTNPGDESRNSRSDLYTVLSSRGSTTARRMYAFRCGAGRLSSAVGR